MPGETSGGKPVYRREDGKAWIEFRSSLEKWQVKSEDNRGTDKCWMGTLKKCAGTTCVEEVTCGWQAWNVTTKKWEEQAGACVQRCSNP